MNITDARELITTLQAELEQFKGIFGDYDEPTRTYEQAEVMWNTLKAQLAALQKLNHPSCLLCGKTEPCMTDAEGVANGGPGKPCTFDMTPRQIFDWCSELRKQLAERDKAIKTCAVDTIRELKCEVEDALKRATPPANARLIMEATIEFLENSAIEKEMKQ